MIKVCIKKEPAESTEILERLDGMSAAYQLQIDPTIKETIIQEGKKIYSGKKEIMLFLQEYAAFMKQWYDCHCE